MIRNKSEEYVVAERTVKWKTCAIFIFVYLNRDAKNNNFKLQCTNICVATASCAHHLWYGNAFLATTLIKTSSK